MDDDPRCCGSGTCIIDEHGQCWCGQRWDGQKMTGPGACEPQDEATEDDGIDRATP